MNTKIILPVAGAWVTTLAAAYFLGSSTAPAPDSATDSAHSDSVAYSSNRSHISSAGSQGGTSSNSRLNRSSRTSNFTSQASASASSIQSISSLSDPLERSRQMLELIDSLGPGDFEATVADFRALGMTRERMGEYNMLLHAWGKVDPLGAISYAQANSRSDHAVQEVLASWATSNPNAALTWARENHDSEKANPYLVGIIGGLADTNPTLATQVLQELPFSEERGEALRSMVPYIAQLGVEGANDWLAGIEDPKLIGGASAYLADHFSKQDPTVGAQWVSSIEDSAARQRAISEVVDNWADKDPVAAQAWIESLSPDDQLTAGPEFVSSYASQDANAAADWLDAQSNSENYQDLLKEFASGATRSDPVLALNYGNELNDEDSRSRTVGRALWTLYRKDKDSARNWINNNDLPERVQRYVGRMMEDR